MSVLAKKSIDTLQTKQMLPEMTFTWAKCHSKLSDQLSPNADTDLYELLT